MVLSIAKCLPAGLHVYQTLDGKTNFKTEQLILYVFIFLWGSSVIFYSCPVFPPTYYVLNYVIYPIYNVSNLCNV